MPIPTPIPQAQPSPTTFDHLPTKPVRVKPRRHQDQPLLLDQNEVELDYGLSSDEDEEVEDEQLAFEDQEEGAEEGDETIYLEASEGLDLELDGQEEDQQQQDEETDEEDDETNVANLLRR
jgi:hypothetical protein